MSNTKIRTPWYESSGEIPVSLKYFKGTMAEAVMDMADSDPGAVALSFMGKEISYGEMAEQILQCAKALVVSGIKPGDRITIALPNCPQAIYMLYGCNMAGAVANMIHPLSAEKEIEFYINDSKSRLAVTLDQFYDKVKAASQNTSLEAIIVTDIASQLKFPLNIAYKLTQNKNVPKLPKTVINNENVIPWKDLMECAQSFGARSFPKGEDEDVAVILYSGGTTGRTKGIMLSNHNFNALAKQIIATNPMFCPGDRMLSAMPLFHGFGLGVCIHSMLAMGGHCVLVPRFTPESYAKLIPKEKCNFIAGVPTLYEALLRKDYLKGRDLSCLKGVFSGGDTLTPELKKRFDDYLSRHKCNIKVREGYGTTECVTASCLTPPHCYKEGSIGIPFPDTFYKIVQPGTDIELDYGQEGEILISGPTVMLGYVDAPEETAQTLRTHSDGHLWLYTGDLGIMDEDGFITFKGRKKRMIISSGYNIYPAQLENILDAHEYVHMSCVIGVPDPYKMQKVKAFIVLQEGVKPSEDTKEEILEYCKKYMAKYMMPKEIEFRDSLPKTLVGKVAYRQLEEEEDAKRQNQ